MRREREREREKEKKTSDVDPKDARIKELESEVDYLTNMITSTLEFIDATENSFSNLRDKAKKTFVNSPINRKKYSQELKKK